MSPHETESIFVTVGYTTSDLMSPHKAESIFVTVGYTTSDLMSPHEAESIFVTVGYTNIRPDVTTWSRKYFCYSGVHQHQTWCHHMKQKVFLLHCGKTNIRPDVTTWSRKYFCYSGVHQHQTWCHHIKQKVFLLQCGTPTSDLMSPHKAESIFVTVGYTNIRPDVTT